MIVLGIESTCDETSFAVVKDGREIIAHRIASQEDLHSVYGGVVPELACRRHIDVLLPLLSETLADAQLTLEQIDLIAVAYGPGLIGALLIGVNAAKTLSLALNKPFIGINHLEAHIYAPLMELDNFEPLLPTLGVIISGGNTLLVHMEGIGSYQVIGSTHDDAIGEAFDKVAVLLGLPYPGGPHIEKMAAQGNASRFPFKAGLVKGHPLDFSFSGLKTNVLYTTQSLPKPLSDSDRADIAASFQQAALQDIVSKIGLAITKYPVRSILLGGGVTSSQYLRCLLQSQLGSLPLLWPPKGLSMDNAAMIAALAYHQFHRSGPASLTIQPNPKLQL